ncbi:MULTISPECIES: DUF4232 domain-containing protein [Streptomyces]|uniref:DUF4232 domain-containing protein n=1 Tax=Streptomyces TaxID=1883 RepID=UPI0013B69330|nr:MULTISPECIES: DUF4232 domain-containing protein [Streptomyces]NEE41676.1 DUF4232 domain-containing protein [Streptomyces sp. SID7982]NEE45716.1 DUF4232 domain-containing protein [Streptomyces sp. SID8455]WSU36504.1 DUF4232 domain-containing protein [Streptomyces gougerotii]MDQ0294158.1 hypothetical protein [Streptomyces sp. DSM 41037]GFH64319.1 hypothetical protein Srut_08330 [Streptomyces rutgersensis]
MRVRPLPALASACAALVAVAPQAGAATTADRAPLATCRAFAVEVGAKADAQDRTVVRITVTNQARRTCVVDRLPTVSFGELDGPARHVPAGESGPYRLGAGETAYATVRTVGADGEVRRVGGVTVAGDPSHSGRTFSARELGAGRYVEVWEPVSSWWKGSARAADEAVGVG